MEQPTAKAAEAAGTAAAAPTVGPAGTAVTAAVGVGKGGTATARQRPKAESMAQSSKAQERSSKEEILQELATLNLNSNILFNLKHVQGGGNGYTAETVCHSMGTRGVQNG